MKKNKLLESFDLIDDKFIDEAENEVSTLYSSKRTRRNALIGGAALLMSVLVVFTSIYFLKDPQPIQTPVNTDYLTETPPDSSFGTPVHPPTCEPDITLGDDIRLEHISRELFEKSEYKELIKKTAIFLYDHNHNNEYNYQCPFLESDIVELHDNTWELQYENTTYCEINGVIEGSTLIQSDDYTYYFSREAIIKDDTTGEEITLSNVLQIYKIKNGEATLISRTSLSDKFGFEPQLIQEFINEMYISKDNKTLTLFLYNSKDYITTIVSLDVSKPTDIKLKNTVKLTGKYETSRSVDGKIIFVGSNRFFHVPLNGDHNHYMISYNDQSNYVPQIDFGKGFEYFLPTEIVCPENITNLKYTIIYQFDENTFEPVSKLAYMAKPTMFYFTSETLYLVTAIKEQKP
ncbi:MAG: hypothetical protein E7675_01225, partial [Ruminococcaceae bacterium]|nr:hypothetical protein [Oscillospiraceae bacterium]